MVLRGETVIKKVVDEPAPETRRASVPTTRPACTADRWPWEPRRSRADHLPKPNPWCMGEILRSARLIMGILNVTPDSFSDGGDHLDPGVRNRRRVAE